MTLPLEQSMEREMTELTLTIDPNGLWRKQRFEFCNALEAAVSPIAGPLRSAAVAELERMDVKVVAKAEQEAGK